MQTFEDILRLYDYVFPKERIAHRPATPRDSAKLVVCDRKSDALRWTTVRHLPEFIPSNAVLVLNDTKVIPARLMLTRATGGRVQALVLERDGLTLQALCNKKLKPGEFLTLSGKYGFVVEESAGKGWKLKATCTLPTLEKLLNRYGKTPLPPYIKSTMREADLRKRYQSVFARAKGSIAAPTASLHFTPALLARLKKQGVTLVYITLHVHLGTFAPLSEAQWKAGKLHPEYFSISKETAAVLHRARREGRPIIAVGTTVTRALESAATKKEIRAGEGDTRLFIREPYRFRVVTGLLTNFHVPKSSLLMLVSTLFGREKLLSVYEKAIARRFRLFSFGDAMLIL